MQEDKRIQKQAVTRLVKRNFKKNKLRSTVLILAVMLVTVLMTVMLGAGISTMDNLNLANLRVKGTDANGFLMNPGDAMETLKDVSEISRISWQQYVAEIHTEEELPGKNKLVMTAYDETEWKENIKPTISGQEGNYPEKENEVMISEWSLKSLGITEPEIGMEIPLSFTTLDGTAVELNFVLSGYYKDYIYRAGITPNSGNTAAANNYYANQGSSRRAVGNMVVSKAFAKIYGTEEGKMGTCLIDDKLDSDEALALLEEHTGRNDVIVAGLTKNIGQSISVAILPFACVLLIVIAGYLLIYNVVNISVLQEMHLYGQLKTLGATTRQLKAMVRKQSRLVACIGIPLGLLIRTGFSMLVIPVMMGKLTEGNGFGEAFTNEVSVSPVIYLLAAAFAFFTVSISNRKPAKMAASVSPVEALKYVEYTGGMKARKGSSGGKLHRMAWRNVFRNKKRTAVTFASLFFGLVLYLVISTCLYGVDYEKKYQREIPDSFIVRNLTYQTEDISTIEDYFTPETVERISKLDGVESIAADYVEPVRFLSGTEELDAYVKEQAFYEELSEEEVKADFQGEAVGLSLEQIQKFRYQSTLSEEEIQEKLESGEGIFLTDLGMEEYRQISGTEVRVSDRDGSAETTYTILGTLYSSSKDDYENSFIGYGYVNGDNAVFFYTTEQGIRRLKETPRIQTLRINAADCKDEQIWEELQNLFLSEEGISMDSQLETKRGTDEGFISIYMSGMIFACFLIGMGLLNFVNVIFTNIYARQKELATLESIGMTRKQSKKVLILEGMYYSIITMALLLTAGLLLSVLAFGLVQKLIYFAMFGIPVLQLLLMFAAMILICAVVPLLVYRSISRESIVERLRKGQD